jgi:hypothetical protein
VGAEQPDCRFTSNFVSYAEAGLLSEVFLTAGEMAILAWPLAAQPAPVNPPTLAADGPTARLQQQVDIGLLRRATDYLRQEIEQQRSIIDRTRRQLPRGWYRNSNPTSDLEVIATGPSRTRLLDLPKVWPDYYRSSYHS